MPFYRFEDFESHRFNPHLSTAVGPVIEGEYMYFRLVSKHAGTGARMHYHPNELMAFPLEGRINCMVGKDRRVVTPGTFVHIPPFAPRWPPQTPPPVAGSNSPTPAAGRVGL